MGTNAASPDAGNPQSSIPSELALARQVLEAVPSVIYVFDVKDEKNVYQNRRLGELLGEASAEDDGIRGLSEWRRYIHPDDAARWPAQLARLRAIRPGETIHWECRVKAKNGEWRWFSTQDVLLQSDADGTPRLVAGSASDSTTHKQVEEYKDILIEEMQHRARNLSTLIDAIGRQSIPPGEPSVETFFNAYVARMRALLRAGELILASKDRVADLQALLKAALRPFGVEGDTSTRFKIEGPTVAVSEQIAGSVVLAIHELATNAAKYGALTSPKGAIAIKWRRTGERVTLDWKEKGGPPVSEPSRHGFGGRVIRHLAVREASGAVSVLYEPDGLRCRLAFGIAA